MKHKEIAEQLRNSPTPANCGQTLLMAYAEELGLSTEQARKMGTNFGAGLLCGNVCGTVNAGMLILSGLGVSPAASAGFVKKFAGSHCSLNCSELLAAARNAGISKKQHCDELIYEVIEEIDGILAEQI